MKRKNLALILVAAVMMISSSTYRESKMATMEVWDYHGNLIDEIRVHKDDMHTLARNIRTDLFLYEKPDSYPVQGVRVYRTSINKTSNSSQ